MGDRSRRGGGTITLTPSPFCPRPKGRPPPPPPDLPLPPFSPRGRDDPASFCSASTMPLSYLGSHACISDLQHVYRSLAVCLHQLCFSPARGRSALCEGTANSLFIHGFISSHLQSRLASWFCPRCSRPLALSLLVCV